MKVCVKYIEENGEWLIENRQERSYKEAEDVGEGGKACMDVQE